MYVLSLVGIRATSVPNTSYTNYHESLLANPILISGTHYSMYAMNLNKLTANNLEANSFPRMLYTVSGQKTLEG